MQQGMFLRGRKELKQAAITYSLYQESSLRAGLWSNLLVNQELLEEET